MITFLTHHGFVTTAALNVVIVSSGKGLLPVQLQAITWANDNLL